MTHENAAWGLACSGLYTSVVELSKVNALILMVLVVAKMGRERIFFILLYLLQFGTL